MVLNRIRKLCATNYSNADVNRDKTGIVKLKIKLIKKINQLEKVCHLTQSIVEFMQFPKNLTQFKPIQSMMDPIHVQLWSSWMENCTKFGQFILRKIIKIVATSCDILKRKWTKFDFGWDSAPDPAGGAYSAPPDPLAGIEGAYF